MKTNLINVSTLEEWLALSEDERERRVAWWPFKFYVEPYALVYEEWPKFRAYVKKKYPVQAFFRYTIYNIAYSIKRTLSHYFWKVRHIVSNPRKKMRKMVFPPYYQDLDTTIINFIDQCIIEFIEREKCFEETGFSESLKNQFGN